MDELQQTRTTAAQGLAPPKASELQPLVLDMKPQASDVEPLVLAVEPQELAVEPQVPDAEPQQDFSAYYRRNLGKVIRHLMHQGAEPHEAAEAAQAAFVEAYATWQQIKCPGAWLRRVAFRFLLRQSLREVLSGELPDAASPDCPVRNVEIHEEEARVLAALSELPITQRRVMAWRLDKYSTKEIAEELGVTQEAVRKNLERARKQLKQSLGITEGGEQ
ncbi:sigma-70 family RNA polymerase sigma factor [Streptomyces umbrinus]|uniref:sigma-70 family RNA polymerase sigma factor n=1 Tax=Streptomyces umbrinus TaxID=67370 RepID=UPI0034459697